MNRRERRQAVATERRAGNIREIAGLKEEIEDRTSMVALALSALFGLASRELGTAADAEALSGRMVEYVSAGLELLESGSVPPDGTQELFMQKLTEAIRKRHSCGNCPSCLRLEEIQNRC